MFNWCRRSGVAIALAVGVVAFAAGCREHDTLSASAPESSDTTEVSTSTVVADPFCLAFADAFAVMQDELIKLASGSSAEDGLRRIGQLMVTMYSPLIEIAPPEIREDLAALLSSNEDVAAGRGWQQTEEALDREQLATERLAQFATERCGLDDVSAFEL